MKSLCFTGSVLILLVSVSGVAQAEPNHFGPRYRRAMQQMRGNDMGARAFNATSREIERSILRNPASRQALNRTMNDFGKGMGTFGREMGNWGKNFGQVMANFARARARQPIRRYGL